MRAASTGLAAGFCALAAAITIAVAVGGTHRPGVALGLLTATVLVLAACSTVPTGLAAAAMGWLFYAGFISGRHAQLTWQGIVDVQRLGVLFGAVLCGVAVRLLIGATPRQPESAPEPDPAPVIDLAKARAERASRAFPAAIESGGLCGHSRRFDVRNHSARSCASLGVAAVVGCRGCVRRTGP